MNANVIKTIDTNYKNGYVHCDKCGYHKDFGDGFNQYHIDSCPNCNGEISLRTQNTVTTGRAGNYKIEHGNFKYFVMSNGINVQFSKQVYSTEYASRISS